MLDAWLDAYRDPLFWLFPVAASAVSMGAFVIFATPLTAIAWLDPAPLRKYRIQNRKGSRQEIVGPSIRLWLANNAIQLALVVLLWPLLRHAGVHAGPLPPWWVVVAQVVFFIYLDDFLFYFMHRALHDGWAYKKIHAIHHRMTIPWAVTAHYMHPVEFLATAALMLLGPLVLGVHVVTLWVWIVWRQWEAAEGHCGYELPGSPTHLVPLNDGAVYHDFHHAKIRGNYAGFLSWVDGVFGDYSRGYLDDRARRGKRPPPFVRSAGASGPLH